MKDNNPFFSVIIPTYNRANLIGETLASVFEQTFTDFEVLVIDDGSTDATKQVVDSFTDERLKYIYQNNSERGAARNNGIKKSSGQYVTFLDSDDLFMHHHLETVFENLQQHSFPPFYHQSFQIEDTAGVIDEYHINIFKNPTKELLTKGNYFGCAGLFLKKDIANLFLFDETRTLAGSEDYEMLLRLTLQVPIICGKESTTRVINHEGRGEFSINKNKLIARIDYLLNKTLTNKEFIIKNKKWLNAFISTNYSFVALHLAIAKEKKTAIRFLIKAIKANPFCIFSKRIVIIVYKILF